MQLVKETFEKWLKILYFPLHSSQKYEEVKRVRKRGEFTLFIRHLICWQKFYSNIQNEPKVNDPKNMKMTQN